LLFAFIYSVLQFFYTVFIVLRAAVRAIVSLAVLLGFTCLVAFVYFVYFYEQINDYDYDYDYDMCSAISTHCQSLTRRGGKTEIPSQKLIRTIARQNADAR